MPTKKRDDLLVSIDRIVDRIVLTRHLDSSTLQRMNAKYLDHFRTLEDTREFFQGVVAGINGATPDYTRPEAWHDGREYGIQVQAIDTPAARKGKETHETLRLLSSD